MWKNPTCDKLYERTHPVSNKLYITLLVDTPWGSQNFITYVREIISLKGKLVKATIAITVYGDKLYTYICDTQVENLQPDLKVLSNLFN